MSDFAKGSQHNSILIKWKFSLQKVVDWFCAYNCSKQSFPISTLGFAINLNKLIELNKKNFKSFNLDPNTDLIEFISKNVQMDELEGKFCKEVKNGLKLKNSISI